MNNSSMEMENKTKELGMLLQQFFTLDPNNPKRTEIDSYLSNYRKQKDSYEHVKYYLTHSTNEHVIWFSVSILEDKVNKSWETVSPQERTGFVNLLHEIYFNNTKSTSNYIGPKIGQVLADMERFEFLYNPQSSQQYILNMTNLVKNQATSLKAINLLQYISVEFLTTKNVLLQEKKIQLKKILSEQVPTIINTLTDYLNQLFNQNAEKKFKHGNLFQNVSFQVGSPDTNTYTGSFSNESKLITKAIFDALLSYFSWISLSELLTPSLLDILFKYLRLDTNNIPALECLNEILSKNCVPKEFEEFLMRIFHQIFSLLTDITANQGSNIHQYNPAFLVKFTQFIALFVTNHLKRVESNPNFRISDFLSLLFQYSFLQTNSENFLHCLGIWTTFLDYLILQVNDKGITPPTKYTDGLIMFQSELVKRTLYSFSKDILSDVDDLDGLLDDEEDNDEEPIEIYKKKCIEAVSKVAELYPNSSLENLYPLFTQNITSFFQKIEENIKQGINIETGDDMVYLVSDVITILSLFGRLAEQFVVCFAPTFNAANFVFQQLLDMCSYTTSHNTFKYAPIWEKLQVQLLQSIRSFSYWLLEYGNQVRSVPSQQPEFELHISKIINVIGPLLKNDIPEEISQAAGQLLMSLVIVSKPMNLFASAETLIANIHQICNPLSSKDQSIIYSAISCTILNPPSSVNLSHQWDMRRPKYSPFIKGITAYYLEIPQIPGFVENKIFCQEEIIERIQKILGILTSIIKTSPEASVAKGILHDGISDTLPVTLGLFKVYVCYPKVLGSILNFFFALFEFLKTQVGLTFTQQTINTFLEVLGGDNLKQLLAESNVTGTAIIKKLIEILTFVVQTSGHNFESLLGSTIDFSMEKLYPIIKDSTSPIKPSFFTLLYSILDCQWKHCQSEQYNKILSAFQTSFQQNDVNLFKQNLDSFEKLNKKLNFYEKISLMEPVFGCSFITIFFDLLISNPQGIHTEDIINTIYHFASINFDKFFNEFFNNYLMVKQNISNEQKMNLRSNFSSDKDQPTFNRNMIRFINDFAYYTYINQ